MKIEFFGDKHRCSDCGNFWLPQSQPVPHTQACVDAWLAERRAVIQAAIGAMRNIKPWADNDSLAQFKYESGPQDPMAGLITAPAPSWADNGWNASSRPPNTVALIPWREKTPNIKWNQAPDIVVNNPAPGLTAFPSEPAKRFGDDFVICKICGGRQEHDIRTGELGPCDVCNGEYIKFCDEPALPFPESASKPVTVTESGKEPLYTGRPERIFQSQIPVFWPTPLQESGPAESRIQNCTRAPWHEGPCNGWQCIPLNSITQGNCLDLLPRIPSGSVDMVLCDLPYGTTQNKWDSVIPFAPLWEQYRRLLKPGGVVVLTASQPFASALVASNFGEFKYEWIWHKSKITGVLNAKKQPVRCHEQVLVFYAVQPSYNPQGLKAFGQITKQGSSSSNYRERPTKPYVQAFTGYPRSVLEIKSEGHCLHPTQKPVALFEYLIRTYTNEGDTVLDNCCGSGTTGVACQNTGRNFIQFELSEEYCEIARKRLKSIADEERLAA